MRLGWWKRISLSVKVHLVELVSQSLEFQRYTCLVHNLYCTCEDVERLHCLMLDVLVLDEGRSLLSAAKKNVHNLLCLY